MTTDTKPQQEVPAVGKSGFDHKTAADFLTGKTVSDEAMRKFVAASRWAHDDRAGLQAALLSVRNELASREAEIALLKTELMNAEVAPQQEAQEPDFWTVCAQYEGGDESGWIPLPGYSNETEHGVKNLVLQAARKEGYKGTVTGRLMELNWEIRPVYLAPWVAPQPSPAAQGDALDTMRLDWLDADESRCVFHFGKSWYTRPSYGLPYRKRASLREAIDAARAAQEGK